MVGGFGPGDGGDEAAAHEVIEDFLFFAEELAVVALMLLILEVLDGFAVLAGGEHGAVGLLEGGFGFLEAAGGVLLPGLEDLTPGTGEGGAGGGGAFREFAGEVVRGLGEFAVGGEEALMGFLAGGEGAAVGFEGLLFGLLADGEEGLEGETEFLHGVFGVGLGEDGGGVASV